MFGMTEAPVSVIHHSDSKIFQAQDSFIGKHEVRNFYPKGKECTLMVKHC